MKIKSIVLIILIYLLIVFTGITMAENNFDDSVKNKTPLEVKFSLKPFDFQMASDDYIFYINNKAISNIKDKGDSIVSNIKDKGDSIVSNIKEKEDSIVSNIKNQGEKLVEKVNSNKIINTFKNKNNQ